MTGRTIEELAVGDAATLTRAVTPEIIQEYVSASGDANPVHSDPAFAASTRFGRIIAPGMLTGGLISAVIGTTLPGPGTIYLSQELRFLKPVYVGDVITTRVVVEEVVRERNRLRLKTACTNQDGEVVLDGEAWVMPSKVHVEYEAPRQGRDRREEWSYTYVPAALAAQVMSLWLATGLAMTNEAFRLCRPASRQSAPEVDPVRP